MVEYAGNMLPIEVKSGKGYERHNALSNVMENEDYPIYMITFFEQVQAEEKVYKFDLTWL